MDAGQEHQTPHLISADLSLHHLLSGGSPPAPIEEQQQDSSDDEAPTEADIGDEDSPADSSASIISVWKPHGKGPSQMAAEHFTQLPRRSTRKSKQTKRFVSYELPAPKPKRARTTRTAQTGSAGSAHTISVQSVFESLAPQSRPTSKAVPEKEHHRSDSDSFEILPTPEAPPIEYFEITDSPLCTVSISSASNGIDVVTISSGSDGVSGVVSGVVSDIHNATDLGTVHVSDEKSVASEASELSSVSTTSQTLHQAAVSEPSTPILTPAQQQATHLTTIPQSPLSTTLRTLTTLTTSALVTPNTQLLSSTSSTTSLHIVPNTSLYAPPTTHAPLYTTARNTTIDEPELQLPYIHTSSKVHIYTPNVADFQRVRDFLDHALTPADITKISATGDTTPIAVCRNMTFPSLPSHYLCLDLSREPLSVRYFWKLLHKAQNPQNRA